MALRGNFKTSDWILKNELHLIKVNATMPMGAMGQANIDADTVFTKD